jgi:hypothetical protein
MPKEFINLLRNEKLREEIIDCIRSTCNYAGTFFDNPGDDFPGAEDDEEYLWDCAFEAGKSFAGGEDDVDAPEDSFQKYFFNKISYPWPVQPEELTETLLKMACSKEFSYPLTGDELTTAVHHLYNVFLSYVENHLLTYRQSSPFAICRIKSKDTSFIDGFLIGRLEDENKRKESILSELNKEDEKARPLWMKNGISVILEPRFVEKGKYQTEEGNIFREDEYVFNAIIKGEISSASLQKLYGQISRALPSIIQSFVLLSPFKGEPFTNFNAIPFIDENFFDKNGALIKNCLDLFFTEPAKKDSMERRIRNAIHLLVESDNQTVDAIGLALSMAAIEALLGQKEDGLSEKLGRRISTLLEPESSKRNNVEIFFKPLYSLRSDALHGTKIDAESQARKNTRHLAAAVLIAVLNRRDFLMRSGYESETPDALLKELYDKTREAGQPMGVPELNIRSLWANKKD